MSLLLDTNIIIFATRFQDLKPFLSFINPEGVELYISVVTLAEAKSIILQNGWSNRKVQRFDAIVSLLNIIEVTDYLTNTYIQIDAFSQRRNPSFQQYNFDTPRNMGKNDLWISATASLLQLKLVTTDADFNHLFKAFLELRYIQPAEIKQLLDDKVS